MSTHGAAARKRNAFADPRPDEPIFRTVSVEISEDSQSRYGDDIWLLWPMAHKTTTTKLKIDFTSLPICYRDTGRRIIWSLINKRTPLDALTRTTSIRDRLSAGAIAQTFPLIRTFLNWLHDRGIEQLCAVTKGDFREYARFVANKNSGREFKSYLLFGVSRIWLIAPHLPEDDQLSCPTWEETLDDDDRLEAVLGPPTHTAGNRTVPVHPQSMSALLLAAQRFVETYGPDILRALNDQAKMRASIPPKFQPDHREKVQAYLRELKASGRTLPGTVGRQNPTPDGSDLAVEYLAASLGVSIGIASSLSGRPVTRGAPMPTAIKGHVDGAPWCEAIDFYEVGLLRHYLMSACFIVTAYLSGMRTEECRALRRGCCTPVEADPGTPAHYEIRGNSFKDALDEEGNTIPGGREREQPWLVVEPVAQAISMAEAVHDGPYVFTDVHFKTRGGGDAARAVSNEAAADSVRRFVKWWNAHCNRTGRLHDRIPEDPEGAITPVRFRRTLAWFIYRIPGGRIALGLQYGHLRGYTSDGYGSRITGGLRDVFPMEEALAVAETLQDGARRLDAGEQVSGPAAVRYISGARAFQRMFEGTFLTRGQMAALRRNPALRIYDNPARALACVYDQAKALCHPERQSNQGDHTKTPDMTRCRDNCPNAARTDTHAEILRHEIAELRDEADSELTPEPIRERLLTRIARREHELRIHDINREPA